MLHRGDWLLFFAGLFYIVKYVGHTVAQSLDFLGVIPNYFMWTFLILAIADYAYRLWSVIKKYRDKKKAEEQARMEKLKEEKEAR